MTGQEFYTYRASAIGVIVLLYSYPSKRSWKKLVERYATKSDEPPVPPEPPTAPELGL